MHLRENEGIEGKAFVVTGGLGFVGAALCLELIRRGARQVRAIDFRSTSSWSDDLKSKGVDCIQGDSSSIWHSYLISLLVSDMFSFLFSLSVLLDFLKCDLLGFGIVVLSD